MRIYEGRPPTRVEDSRRKQPRHRLADALFEELVDLPAEQRSSLLAERCGGDATLRTHLPDVVRALPWPQEFTARIQRNGFVNRWRGRESELAQEIDVEGPRYLQAFADGDPENTAVWFGEAAGLIDAVEPAATIVERMVTEATHLQRSLN